MVNWDLSLTISSLTSIPLCPVGQYDPSGKPLTLWKVVVTSLSLTGLGKFIKSGWKKPLRTIQRSVHHLNLLYNCECQWDSPAVQTLSKSHEKGTRKHNLEIDSSLFWWLHHSFPHNRRTPWPPSWNFSKVQNGQSQNQGPVGIQADPEKTSAVKKYTVQKKGTEIKIFFRSLFIL